MSQEYRQLCDQTTSQEFLHICVQSLIFRIHHCYEEEEEDFGKYHSAVGDRIKPVTNNTLLSKLRLYSPRVYEYVFDTYDRHEIP